MVKPCAHVPDGHLEVFPALAVLPLDCRVLLLELLDVRLHEGSEV